MCACARDRDTYIEQRHFHWVSELRVNIEYLGLTSCCHSCSTKLRRNSHLQWKEREKIDFFVALVDWCADFQFNTNRQNRKLVEKPTSKWKFEFASQIVVDVLNLCVSLTKKIAVKIYWIEFFFVCRFFSSSLLFAVHFSVAVRLCKQTNKFYWFELAIPDKASSVLFLCGANNFLCISKVQSFLRKITRDFSIARMFFVLN